MKVETHIDAHQNSFRAFARGQFGRVFVTFVTVDIALGAYG